MVASKKKAEEELNFGFEDVGQFILPAPGLSLGWGLDRMKPFHSDCLPVMLCLLSRVKW
jgi:hypothetical protein